MDETKSDGLYEVEPGQRGFRATLMEGPDLNLATIAGFSDGDPVVEQAWENVNWKRLLGACFSAEVLDQADLDGRDPDEDDLIPGMSDSWYVIRVSDSAVFAQELRAAFLLAARDPEQLE